MKLCDAEPDLCCQGIRFLVDSSLLKNTHEDIAKFLYKGEGLNKTAIGDYLGERLEHVCVWKHVFTVYYIYMLYIIYTLCKRHCYLKKFIIILRAQ